MAVINDFITFFLSDLEIQNGIVWQKIPPDAARSQAKSRGGGTGGSARRSAADSSRRLQRRSAADLGGKEKETRKDWSSWEGGGTGHAGHAQEVFPGASPQVCEVSQQQSGCEFSTATAGCGQIIARATPKDTNAFHMQFFNGTNAR
jgi:hypothetical protein